MRIRTHCGVWQRPTIGMPRRRGFFRGLHMNAAVDTLALAPSAPAVRRVATQYRADAHRSLWITIGRPPPGMRANFSPELLDELADVQRTVVDHGHGWPGATGINPVDDVVLA